jgi:hypothetical protein
LSGDGRPTAENRGVLRVESDRKQLAFPTEDPNHHIRTESKAENDRKVFLPVASMDGSAFVTIWREAGRKSVLLLAPSSWAVGIERMKSREYHGDRLAVAITQR